LAPGSAAVTSGQLLVDFSSVPSSSSVDSTLFSATFFSVIPLVDGLALVVVDAEFCAALFLFPTAFSCSFSLAAKK
jgi:hypothetical protein